MKSLLKYLVGSAVVAAASSVLVFTTLANDKVLVCHQTGSASHPLVATKVSAHALDAHLQHGDILANPDGTCGDGGPVPGLE